MPEQPYSLDAKRSQRYRQARTASPEQARLLLAHGQGPLLELLQRAAATGQPRSASELAAALGWTLSAVHYRLRLLLAADIAREASRETRAGRPIRRFDIPDIWFVPFSATPSETHAQAIAAQFTPFISEFSGLAAQSLGAYSEWGHWLESGVMRVGAYAGREQGGERRGRAERGRAERGRAEEQVFAFAGTVRLEPDEVRELQRRLWAVVGEYAGEQEQRQRRKDGTGTPYALGIFMAQGEAK